MSQEIEIIIMDITEDQDMKLLSILRNTCSGHSVLKYFADYIKEQQEGS